MKWFCFFTVLLLVSCSNENTGSKEVIFYGKKIYIPSDLAVSDPPDFVNAEKCDSDLYLKSVEDSIIVQLKLCGHAHVKRKSFKSLKKSFETQTLVVEEYSKGYDLIEKTSVKKENTYEFTHVFEDRGRFYASINIAFKNYFVSLLIEGKDIDLVNKSITDFSYVKDAGFINGISVSEKDLKQACTSCKAPSSW